MLIAPPYLSPSSISTFHQCPLKYKFSRIDGLTERPTIHTVLGNFVHQILEDLYALPEIERTLDNARTLSRQWWDEKYGTEVTETLKENGQQFRWKAWWCIENLWKLENPQNVQLAGIEKEVTGECNGVAVRGFIDRYEHLDDGTLFIGDYKTGKLPHQRFMKDKFTQLLIYAVMLEITGVGKASKLGLIYLAGPEVRTAYVTDEDLETTASLIVNTKKMVDTYCEEGVFPHKVSNLCGWCDFKKICPAWVRKK